MQGARQIRRLELKTGEIHEITSGESVQQGQSSSGGALAPEISPDGRWLAFARRIPDGTISYKGLKFGPRTALWLRDLETGAERLLMDPIEVDMGEGMKVSRDLPGYAWARDGKSIVLTQGGKIRRVDVASGQVSTIPFTARVKRTISEMAGQAAVDRRSRRSPIKYPRWGASSPDGKRLAFQAAGRIYVMDLPSGTPRRLTADSFDADRDVAGVVARRQVDRVHDAVRQSAGPHLEDRRRWRGAGSGAPQQLTQDARRIPQHRVESRRQDHRRDARHRRVGARTHRRRESVLSVREGAGRRRRREGDRHREPALHGRPSA